MSDFADLLAPQPLDLEGSGMTFVDADTLRDADDNRYRIQGIDAPEIAKLDQEGIPGWQGTAGGGVATPTLINLANQYGYTNVVKTGEFDPHGREIVRLQDKDGRDFANQVLKSGVLETNRYTTQQDAVSADIGELMRNREGYEQTDWDKGRERINSAIDAETYYDAGFKQAAINEADLLMGGKSPGFVEFRHTDRDLQNRSLNPLSDSFEAGLRGVGEAMWGVVQMTGETTGWDAAKDLGDAGLTRAHAGLSEMPQLKLSALDDEGNWDINSVGEFFQYMGNNAAMSLPYMAATIGGAVAAPFTYGASMSLPVAIYTGQTWNEMEGEKNAGVAMAAGVTQAVLDRLGLAGIVRGSILKKETLDAATKALAAKNGISETAAKQIIAKQTRMETAKLAGAAGEVAAAQLRAGNIIKAFAGKAAQGAVTEGVTEVLQEATAYGAAVYGSDKQWDNVELSERLINASLAGSTLGGGFAIPGTIYDVGAWTDVAVRQAPAEASRLSMAGRRAQKEKQQRGRIASIQELNDETQLDVNRRQGRVESWSDRVDRHKKSKEGRNVSTILSDTWAGIPGLWRGATRNIFTDQLQERSRAAMKLADMFGANLQRTFSGSNFENRKHHLVSQYRNMVTNPAKFAQAAGVSRTINLKEPIQALTNEVLAAEKANRDINWDALPQEHRAWLSQYYNEVKTLGDKLYTDQAKHNPQLGYLKNYLFHFKAFNKAAIERNKNSFIQKLVDKGMDHKDAEAITDNILHTDMVNSEADFSVGQGQFIPGSHRARTLNLADDVNFHEFMETNPFANISQAAKSASRYVAYEEFLGKDNQKINELLQQMLDEGISQAEVDKVAAQMQDYLDAESGNYKRIENKTWDAVQRNLMFWTTLAGLPLATISSMVELALTTRSLNQTQIFKVIGSAAKDAAHGMFDAITNVPVVGAARGARAKDERQSTIADLGYHNWEVGAATTTGVSEVSNSKMKFIDMYFKAIGLQQWTDYTRNVRASIAGDFIFDKVALIRKQRDNGELYTNEIQEAEEQLRNLGINVDSMVELLRGDGPLSPEEELALSQNMREGMFNFVNEAVALPQSANRPLFYQNPHLALFTQFQGFIATFTANHIPKMWGELVSRGTPSMKYNAFAMMSTMIALGFVSQYLKDLLKYGEPSPYLDDAEKFQRAIGASGLLGTGERVLNTFFPIYETSADNPAEWFFGAVSGEAAALSNVSRTVEGAGELAFGDAERGAYKIAKATPLIGPLNQVNRAIAEGLFGG